MSTSRDYTLIYRVDTSQAGPAFAQMRTGLTEVRADLLAITTAANGATNAFTAMGAAAPAGIGAVSTHTAAANTHMMGLNTSTLRTIAVMAGLTATITIVQDLGQNIAKVREHMRELGDEAIKTRDEMREVAILKGQLDGPSDQVLAESHAFGLDAGMTAKQATRFLEQFYGSNSAGLAKHNVGGGINPGETQEQYEDRVKPITDGIALEGARFAQRNKLSQATAGDMAGVVSQYNKITTPQEAAQKFGRIGHALTKGRGNMEPLMKGFMNTAGAMVDDNDSGIIGSDEELAAMYGSMSAFHGPVKTGTFVKKAARALRDFTGTQKDGLEEMGITPKDSHMEAVNKVAARIKADQAKGMKPDESLMMLGFSDKTDRQAIEEEVKTLDVAAVRRAEMQKISGADVQAHNARFQQKNLTGINQRLDAAKDTTDWIKGEKAEKMRMAQKAAAIRMRNSGHYNTTELLMLDKVADMGGILPAIGVTPALQDRINREALAGLAGAHASAGNHREADRLNTMINGNGGTMVDMVPDFLPSLKGTAALADKFVPNGIKSTITDRDVMDAFNNDAQGLIDKGADPFPVKGLKGQLQRTAKDDATKKAWDNAQHMQKVGPQGQKDRDAALQKARDDAARQRIQGLNKNVGPQASAGGASTDALLGQLVAETRAQTAALEILAGSNFGMPESAPVRSHRA